MDDAAACLRDEPIAGFIADALVCGPVDAFHVNCLNKAISFREYSNARLLALTGDPALASLLYSLTGGVVLLDIAVAMIFRFMQAGSNLSPKRV